MIYPSLRSTLLVLTLLLCAAPGAFADVISGRVVSPTGAGVAGIDIDVEDFITGVPVTVSADFTDADGNFQTILPPGTYTVTFKPQATNLFTGFFEPVVVSGNTDMGEIVLRKAFTISGRVENQAGTGVAGVNIDVVDLETKLDMPIVDDVTPANGQFAVRVPEGELEIQFNAPNTGPMLASALTEMTVTKNTGLGTIVLQPGFTLSATLRKPGGQPVVNADTDVRDAVTDEKLFTPNDNSSGTGAVSVIVPAGDYVFVAQPLFADGLASLSTPATVNGNTNLGVLTHENGVVLSGTVTANGLPLSDIDIDLNDPVDNSVVPLSMDNTNSLGAYAIQVPVGTWDILFSPVNGEAFSPVLFEDMTINGDTTLDVVLLDCAAPCGVTPGTSVIPGVGPKEGGNLVTLRGSNFVDNGSTQVLFGATPGTVVSVTPPGTLMVQAPAGTPDVTVNVTVNSSMGSQMLPDTYTYGDLTLALGHRLEGSLPIGDVDRILVEAVAGSKLNISLKPVKGGSLQPQMRIIGPDGSELLSAADSIAKPNLAKSGKLTTGLTGVHVLELSQAAGSSGDYVLNTKVKVPKSQKSEIAVDAQTPTALASFGALDGWTLVKATIASKKSKTAPIGPFPPQITLLDPDNNPVDLTGLVTTNKSGFTVSFKGLPLDTPGVWRIQVMSADSRSGQAKVTVKTKAPKVPKTVIIEDS